MGVMSKPYKFTFRLIGTYLNQLYTNPVQTKSIVNCISAGLASYLSQWLAHGKLVDYDALIAFMSFGLLFGGSIPHYFNTIITNFVYGNSKNPLIQFLLIDRLFFMPAFLFFTLYALSRLKRKNHETSLNASLALLQSLFEINIKYFTLLHYINIYFVPEGLRILTCDFINFIWFLVLSFVKQQKEESNKKNKKEKKNLFK